MWIIHIRPVHFRSGRRNFLRSAYQAFFARQLPIKNVQFLHSVSKRFLSHSFFTVDDRQSVRFSGRT